MNLNFSIIFEDLPAFIEHWAQIYEEKNKKVEHLYKENMGKELTVEDRLKKRRALFKWKNGGRLSAKKLKSVRKHYPYKLPATNDLESIYLSSNNFGGKIWNIFYLHIISPEDYPIFDQHVYRAWCFIKSKKPRELEKYGRNDTFSEYNEYKKFYKEILMAVGDDDERKIDKALLSFGQFLKKVQPYQRPD